MAWQVLRFGCTVGNHARVSTCSDGWQGYAVDVLDAGAFTRYWDAVVEPLIADAGPLAGRTLKYLHTDSWEVEAINWTAGLREAFRQRRGYDLLPFLPVLAGSPSRTPLAEMETLASQPAPKLAFTITDTFIIFGAEKTVEQALRTLNDKSSSISSAKWFNAARSAIQSSVGLAALEDNAPFCESVAMSVPGVPSFT